MSWTRWTIARWRATAAGDDATRCASGAASGARGGGAVAVDRAQRRGRRAATRSMRGRSSCRSTSWEEVDALAARARSVRPAGDLLRRHGRAAGGGVRRDWERRRPGGRRVDGAARVREGPAEDVREDGAVAAAGTAAGEGGRRAGAAAAGARASCSRRPAAGGSTSTTGARASGRPRSKAAGVEHRRIYDMRHTFATWSLAAGMSIFTLARRMGTSVPMIDARTGTWRTTRTSTTAICWTPTTRRARGHVVGTETDENEPDEAAAA